MASQGHDTDMGAGWEGGNTGSMSEDLVMLETNITGNEYDS